MDVGFIGLGAMGAGMAANLVKAGHRVTVWNRSSSGSDRLVALGAERAATPAQAASGAALISMLSNDAAVRAVLIDDGVVERLTPGAVHVNMATISLDLAKELAATHRRRGVGYVAAPVMGRPDVAAAGQLNILAAGAAGDIERVQPLLDALGQKTWRFGDEPERANAVKLAANFMLACAVESMAEAIAFLSAQDVPATAFLDMIANTAFAAPVYKGYGRLIAEERYSPPGFKLSLGGKDVGLVLEAADKAYVPMPFASVLRDNILDAMARGEGDLDLAALAKVALRRAARGQAR
jgi:3-hydroxyisobutyrate dehydrogenase-like beta-hydroxyacid dehydrogenase